MTDTQGDHVVQTATGAKLVAYRTICPGTIHTCVFETTPDRNGISFGQHS